MKSTRRTNKRHRKWKHINIRTWREDCGTLKMIILKRICKKQGVETWAEAIWFIGTATEVCNEFQANYLVFKESSVSALIKVICLLPELSFLIGLSHTQQQVTNQHYGPTRCQQSRDIVVICRVRASGGRCRFLHVTHVMVWWLFIRQRAAAGRAGLWWAAQESGNSNNNTLWNMSLTLITTWSRVINLHFIF
jgi:hypothetical protein